MIVGYARTSTVEQIAGLEAQERDLRAAGAERIWQEQGSSLGPRPQLEALLDFVRQGDVLITTKPDRLARSLADLLQIVRRLEAKGVGLRILSLGADTGTSTGRLILNVLGAVAEFERDLMLERQREGIQRARLQGKYRGRAPTARSQAEEVQRLRGEGLRPVEIIRRLGISESSYYRIVGRQTD